jgi:hypothetical protein
MVTVTGNVDARGRLAINKLVASLIDVRRSEQIAARRILRKAQSNAASRPTPQARMVASGMFARRGAVIGFGSRRVFGRGAEGVKLGFLAYGSEFGSDTHRQFGPRNESGYWLHPAAEQNPEMDEVLEEHVDDAIDAAIRVSKIGI